ncbi:acyl-CoA dehydrogenase family protein [Paenisporosarcina sp. TG-14]|uniref:acyl-CoA dehydrogenase family protein n=1 Tax=Paenisporosarcina sp. TG-14 TaxID=1231057 RepID=UPI0002D77C13|nr:acyl-CoA dehydrogenase family protein [Paenisporosarcina sp. TG-14]
MRVVEKVDIKFSEELEKYRNQTREWLKTAIPDWWHHYANRRSDDERYIEFSKSWDKKLHEGGYSGISWPKEYGGRGESVLKEMIFEEEAGRIDAPRGYNFLGKILLGPTLLNYGTEEQKKYFLPRLVKSEDIWCQGFSEPNAGSDLAALQTRAELEGDEWVITGQKVWTTEAQNANWCFVLARTDFSAPKHKGITYFLVPMEAEGVSVRPIRKITGEADFNEIFFDNVRIPKDHYIGELNNGWKVAMTTLSFERGILALGRQARFQTEFEKAVEYVEDKKLPGGDELQGNHYFRQKFAQSFLELRIMRYHSLKTISDYINNNGKLGPEMSLQKLYWSEMRARIGNLLMEVQGENVYLAEEDSPSADHFTNIYFTTRGEIIYAGTSQIQRNIIAEKVLGLPR